MLLWRGGDYVGNAQGARAPGLNPVFTWKQKIHPLLHIFFSPKFFRNQNSLVHISYGLDVLTDWIYLVLRVMEKDQRDELEKQVPATQ